MDYQILTPAVQAVLTAHPDWTDQQVADALNAETVQPPYVPVFGNWRTLATICTADEYNALRTVVVGVAQQEAAANPRGYLINDMAAMLAVPGDAAGTGGGLDLGVPQFVGQLAGLCSLSPALQPCPRRWPPTSLRYNRRRERSGTLSILATSPQRGPCNDNILLDQQHDQADGNDQSPRRLVFFLYDGLARQGTYLDFGDPRAAQWLMTLQTGWAAAPALGGPVMCYMAFADATAGPWPGGASGSDAAYTGPDGTCVDGCTQLTFIGQLNACATSIQQTQDVGVFMPLKRYGTPVVYNGSTQVLATTAASHVLTVESIQDQS